MRLRFLLVVVIHELKRTGIPYILLIALDPSVNVLDKRQTKLEPSAAKHEEEGE